MDVEIKHTLAESHADRSEYDAKDEDESKKYKLEIVWINVAVAVVFHMWALYGFLLLMFVHFKPAVFVMMGAFTFVVGLGVTAGAHRLWAHRSYKARLPLRMYLLLVQTIAVQNSMYEWVRDHRVHHKFTETDADPHNANRGFFFAHMGWLLCKKHPDVKEKGKLVDMSDLEADPLVMFQHKVYPVLSVLGIFVFPTYIFHWMTGLPLIDCFFIGGMLRYVLTLHGTWLVNSAAHMWGYKPYDKNINPVENILIALLAFGEGWHNYHHIFPWDYKTSELGFYRYNFTTAFIDFCAYIGLAYDLKTVSPEIVKRTVEQRGDGSPQMYSIKGIVNCMRTVYNSISMNIIVKDEKQKEK